MTTPTKNPDRRTQERVAAHKRSFSEPVSLDLVDLLCGDDSDMSELASTIEDWFRPQRLEPMASSRERTIPVADEIGLSVQRIRRAVGADAPVGLVVMVKRRDVFDAINFPGQTTSNCAVHGLSIKVFADDNFKIIVMHIADPAPPSCSAHAAMSGAADRVPAAHA